jgi:hypothetical protein
MTAAAQRERVDDIRGIIAEAWRAGSLAGEILGREEDGGA